MPVPPHVGAAISRGDIPTRDAAIATLGAFIAAFIPIGTEATQDTHRRREARVAIVTFLCLGSP
jgi:hypothetical protein